MTGVNDFTPKKRGKPIGGDELREKIRLPLHPLCHELTAGL